jgi:hypothetical protein
MEAKAKHNPLAEDCPVAEGRRAAACPEDGRSGGGRARQSRGRDAVVIRIGRRQVTLEVIRGNNHRD